MKLLKPVTGRLYRRRGATQTKFARSLVLATLIASVGLMGVSTAVASAEVGELPTVKTEGITDVGKTVATVNALVDPNGSVVSECEFEYGTSPTMLFSAIPCALPPGSGENDVTVSAVIEGLTESKTYYYRISATNVFGTQEGDVKHFMTLPSEPAAQIAGASLVKKTSAQLNAAVNPDDANVTECKFEYGETPSYESGYIPCAVLPGSGEKPVHVYATAEGLAEHQKYYYRVIATNSFGTFYSGPESFTTFPYKPAVVTEEASPIGEESATVKGSVNPDDASISSCEFQYGTTPSFGSHASCTSLPSGSGETPEAVSASLTGLTSSTQYYYRLLATNAYGTNYGVTKKFTSLPNRPRVQTRDASEETTDSAQLNAVVNPDESMVTSCAFEYGTSQSYGTTVPCSPSPGSGGTAVPVSAAVSGLKEGTTYDFRVYAINVFGFGYGANKSFKTKVSGLLPKVTQLSPTKGEEKGGTLVTIKGENLYGVEKVDFGTNEATEVTQVKTTEITAVSPPGSLGTVYVTVVTPNGTSATTKKTEFRYKKNKK